MIADEFITLRTFSNFATAKKVVSHLESKGIKATIKRDDSGGMGRQFRETHGVHVIVRKKDAQRARSILAEMNI